MTIFRQERNRDAAVKSRERKKLYVKDLEMKSRYFEGECRRLGMLLNCVIAENQALRLSLHSSKAFDASMTKQESAVLLLGMKIDLSPYFICPVIILLSICLYPIIARFIKLQSLFVFLMVKLLSRVGSIIEIEVFFVCWPLKSTTMYKLTDYLKLVILGHNYCMT